MGYCHSKGELAQEYILYQCWHPGDHHNDWINEQDFWLYPLQRYHQVLHEQKCPNIPEQSAKYGYKDWNSQEYEMEKLGYIAVIFAAYPAVCDMGRVIQIQCAKYRDD